MRNFIRSITTRHRYKAGIFLLLAAASVICIAMMLARQTYSDTRQYRSLVWNLFLAWIPFLLAYASFMFSWKRWHLYLILPVFAFLWLIFFPNAPYILTDLQHLNENTTNVPVWYDVILLVWFSWTGMLLGIVSLNLMQEIVKRNFSRWLGWFFVLLVSGLSSVGIYVGRFIRLNSWDILQYPANTAVNLWNWIQDPSLGSIGFIGLYSLFFLFAYFTIYAFGHLLQEGGLIYHGSVDRP